MTVLRRGYVPVEPDVSGFDDKLREKFAKLDPGGKAGKQLGGQLNRALKRLDLDAIDVRADPKKAAAAIDGVEAKLLALSRNASTVEIKVRAEQGLKEIGRFRKQLGEVTEESGPEAAAGFMAKFGPRLGSLISGLSVAGPMTSVLGGAAIAAAPLIGATVSGAIIGGVGIGGVVGGLAVAAKDERVKGAIEDLGESLQGRLYRAGGAFLQPALDAVDDIEGALDTIDLDSIFADAARYVPSLTAGVGSALTDMGDGIEALVENAGPAVSAISDGIATIGRSVGQGLQLLSDNGPEAASALNTVFAVVDSALTNTFRLVDALTKLYEINQAIGGDFGLQVALKLTGSEMEKTANFAHRVSEGTSGMADILQVAEENSKKLAEAQKVVTTAQQALAASMSLVTEGGARASLTADTLRSAMDKLYGAAIRQTDANESYEASWDSLSAAVKGNGRSLDIHTEAGRANRDVLQGLLSSSNDLYIADINAGVATGKAAAKHRERTEAVREEAARVRLNKDATKDLISTYGKIPPKKTTDLVVSGVNRIAKVLEDLYIVQRALAEGIPIASARAAVKEKGGPAKQFGGFATGGYFDGMLPGPPSRVDNLQGHGPDGKSFGLAGGEMIINAAQTAKHRGVLEAINAGFDGFAQGGYFGPVDTSTRIPMDASMRNFKVLTLAQAKAAVTPAIPEGGRTSDFIVAAARALVPGINVLSKDRPGARTLSGNVSYHSRGRAVDFEPSEKLARLWNERYKARTKELISPYQQYNLHNGQRHTYTGAVWNQHNFAGGNAHDHIAMDDGGFRVLQPGMNRIPNGTGKPELIGGPAALASMTGNTYNLTINVPPTAHPAEVGKEAVKAIQAFEATNGNRWRKDPKP